MRSVILEIKERLKKGMRLLHHNDLEIAMELLHHSELEIGK